ncbi:DUF3800 domain-containing protein [Nonomuraea longicatena]|uniref:DUF3800 domain-containing protein n=1 Tax=Nonomuraea longicatena TaxID=83682 RepID=A0ABN1PTE1_9ACTN
MPEIACDESGAEGEKLVGGNTDVFAHAAVRLDAESAARCLAELRDRAPSPTTEYKSSILRRSKHRRALMWLLGPSSPAYGQVRVHLTDKTHLLIRRLADVLGLTAGELREAGPREFGQAWPRLLEAVNDHMRSGARNGARDPGDLLGLLAEPLRAGSGLARGLLAAMPYLAEFGTREDESPALDPLIPAILRAIAYGASGGVPVTVVHDQQTVLSEERVARIARLSGGLLADFRLVDSRTDARVQVADLLAGAARRIASEELGGHGDPDLTALLRPYVDEGSTWGDARSWRLLAPEAAS